MGSVIGVSTPARRPRLRRRRPTHLQPRPRRRPPRAHAPHPRDHARAPRRQSRRHHRPRRPRPRARRRPHRGLRAGLGALHQGRPSASTPTSPAISFNDYKHLSSGDGGIVATGRADLGPTLTPWGDETLRPHRPRPPRPRRPRAQLPHERAPGRRRRRATHPPRRHHRPPPPRRPTPHLPPRRSPRRPPPHVAPGNTHSYWFYFLRLDLARLGCTRAAWVEALRAEGATATAGYIPTPVYRYRVFPKPQFLRRRLARPRRRPHQNGLPRGQLPPRRVHPHRRRCPPLNEAMSDTYITKVAQAIRTITTRLRPK